MNFKNKLRAFFTLSRKGDGGFTLVELIVVIAVLAILGGVAVPAYSGYVKKANMQADITLAGEIERALMLAYYSGMFGDDFIGGSVILSTDGARIDPADADDVLATAMANTFGAEWDDLKLKYDGWTNTQGDIKTTIAGSNFADGNNVNMELLGAVDNLTGQLSKVMDGEAMNLQNFPGYTQFLNDNGIDPGDTQLAANAAVLYLSQSSMAPENRTEVVGMLADPATWGWNGTFDLENNFIKPVTLQGKCTQFEALAMAYATMQGYCMQKDKELTDNGETPYWAKDFAAIDLTTKSDGITPVDDEIAVMQKLCEEFTAMVDADDRYAFQDYLYDNAEKDITAYYGVIDGISENQDYLKENLDGSDNFYASQENLLKAYWDANYQNGELCVMLYRDANGQWQTNTTGD